jgi:hypothetical protein
MLESILGIWTMSTVDGPKVRNRIRDEAGVSSPVTNPSKAYKAGTIIHDALSFVSVVAPKHKVFTDLRRRHMRGETVFHWNGTNNKDISLAAAYGPPKPETNPEFYKSVQNKTFSDETRSRLPQYYGSPGLFEWVLYDGEIVCECTATEAMYDRLRVAVTARPAAYLGNSESSVIIKINEA